MSDIYEHMDAGVRDIVRYLRDRGWNTTCSCEGGEGHSYEFPTIEIDVGKMEDVDSIGDHLVESGHKPFKIEAVLIVPADGFYTCRCKVTLGTWM